MAVIHMGDTNASWIVPVLFYAWRYHRNID